MNPTVIVLLLCLWLYLAWMSYQRGNMAAAVLFLAVGGALTLWRFRRRGGR